MCCILWVLTIWYYHVNPCAIEFTFTFYCFNFLQYEQLWILVQLKLLLKLSLFVASIFYYGYMYNCPVTHRVQKVVFARVVFVVSANTCPWNQHEMKNPQNIHLHTSHWVQNGKMDETWIQISFGWKAWHQFSALWKVLQYQFRCKVQTIGMQIRLLPFINEIKSSFL